MGLAVVVQVGQGQQRPLRRGRRRRRCAGAKVHHKIRASGSKGYFARGGRKRLGPGPKAVRTQLHLVGSLHTVPDMSPSVPATLASEMQGLLTGLAYSARNRAKAGQGLGAPMGVGSIAPLHSQQATVVCVVAAASVRQGTSELVPGWARSTPAREGRARVQARPRDGGSKAQRNSRTRGMASGEDSQAAKSSRPGGSCAGRGGAGATGAAGIREGNVPEAGKCF